MKKVISHNTRNLVLGGVLRQETLKIGSGSGSEVGIFFNNGNANLPGIRYQKSTNIWEASKDGTNWYPLISGSGAITYSPIVITSTELVNGVATIQHNLGVKYPLGLDFTVTPDNVNFVDENTMTLDYSSHALTGFQAQVWFYKSEQSMLTGGASSNEA